MSDPFINRSSTSLGWLGGIIPTSPFLDRLYIFWVGEKPCNLANKNKLVESCRFLIVKETAQKTVNLKEQRNPADW